MKYYSRFLTHVQEFARVLRAVVAKPKLSAILPTSSQTPLPNFQAARNFRTPTRTCPGVVLQVWTTDSQGVFYGRTHHRVFGEPPKSSATSWCHLEAHELQMDLAESFSFNSGGM